MNSYCNFFDLIRFKHQTLKKGIQGLILITVSGTVIGKFFERENKRSQYISEMLNSQAINCLLIKLLSVIYKIQSSPTAGQTNIKNVKNKNRLQVKYKAKCFANI